MVNKEEIPLVYEIIFEQIKKCVLKSDKMNATIPIKEICKLLGRIYHIPKDYHYNVIRELEDYGLIVLTKEGLEIIKDIKKKQ